MKGIIMTPQGIKEIREKMGMTQKQFAEYLDVTTKTIQNWESGRNKVPSFFDVATLNKK